MILVGGINSLEDQDDQKIKVKLDRTTKIFYDPPDAKPRRSYVAHGQISPI